jgi:thioredoxin reductase (NADPH)
MESIVIVGSGPAGLTAAVYAARGDLAPLVIEGLEPGGQLTTTTEVENYPGFPEGVDGTALMTRMREQAERFGARFAADEVVAADFSGQPLAVTLSDGRQIETRAVIVATGASALYLDLDSVRALQGRGVSACATCDGAFYRDVPVAVVGGGDTAAEEALFLTRFASRVTLIHRRDKLRASTIMADRVKDSAKIDILWDHVVEEVRDVEKGEVTGVRVKHVKTGEVSELEIAGLFMGIGHRPNTAAFKGQIEMDERGYIAADGARTSVPGVFAAGDVRDAVYRQAVTAAGTGCAAALEAEAFLESLH